MSRPKKIDACTGAPTVTKSECILAAAQTVFLESGYAAASMDAVASRANVSKATIYAHFENKRALFEAMISRRCETTFVDLGLPDSYGDARQALLALAEHFIGMIISPEALAIHRVVLGESPRLPEVGEAFYGVGPVKAQARIARLFSELTRRGLLAVPDADIPVLTDLFIGMLKGDLHLRALLQQPPSERTGARIAEGAVDLVLARYGVKG
jgi:TetR/AcrR family transcriptional repressor of mexJK operon